ncbi:MAG TPA: penicillin-binding transpeptidase domain-containing protein [Solirubrobacteraceae bacterium]|nr:penicillin-binding transpeptidase domain-containing protein [Solirubrobacteraceae bacterium]
MNAPIVRLFGVIVVLFALLIVFTSRWTVFQASSLQNNPLNVRTLIDELQVKRGRILASDGTVLAKSVAAPDHTWTRTYPTGPLFAHAVGYSIAAKGEAAGLEESAATYVRGLNTGLSSIFGQLNPRPVGDDVYTTLDPAAQRAAQQALAGEDGSVVAIDPSTGAVKVMYANPTYNDNSSNPGQGCGAKDCLVNRVTEGQYAPGSTFKIVTATAAIDSGMYTENSVINGNSPITVSGVPLNNDGDQSWGPQTLTTAMTYSINTIFAQVAQNVGRATMTKYMKRFGFYSKPPLDYPSGQIGISQPWSSTTGKPFPPGSPDEDIGRIGIGEGGLLVTPLQMAMVASAVADNGTLMKPHMISRVVNPDGVTVSTVNSSVESQVMKPSTAQAVTRMMEKVVEEGTGITVQIPGITIAGKTGTPQIPTATEPNRTQPAFVAFAPAQHPKVAIAVMIDQSNGGYGATVAAPVAKAVLRVLLSEGS